jgi:hypothetical protein
MVSEKYIINLIRENKYIIIYKWIFIINTLNINKNI